MMFKSARTDATTGLSTRASIRPSKGRTTETSRLLLSLGIFLFVGLVSLPGSAAANVTGPYEFFTASSLARQTVIAGFFLEGEIAEIGVIHTDVNGKPSLQMYQFDGEGWQLVLEAALRSEVLFVDKARINGKDRLFTYEPDRLNWFDPETKSERLLVEVSTHFVSTAANEIPHLQVFRDINDDGRDDIVVPDVDGFWIATQSDDGAFAEPFRLGPPEPFLNGAATIGEPGTYGQLGISVNTNPNYQSRVHLADFNQDGRRDLAFWNTDHFDVYFQDSQGQFHETPETTASSVPFFSDGLYSLLLGFDNESNLSLLTGLRKKTSRTVLDKIRDTNGDGIPDLVTVTMTGRSMLKQRLNLDVHFGKADNTGVVFEQDVGTAIKAQGKATAATYSSITLHDDTHSGDVTAMVMEVETGIAGIARALLKRSVALNLSFYRTQSGTFPAEPNMKLRIKRPFFPVFLIGDIIGDEHPDLLVSAGPQHVNIHEGVPTADVFDTDARTILMDITRNEADTHLVNLTSDAKLSVLAYHPSDTGPHRIQVLLSQ